MEKQQKELLDWLDGEIAWQEKIIEEMIECGEMNVDSMEQKKLVNLQALRRLVEKFYGEWQKDANNLNIDFVEWPELVVLVESIRDFDPMKEK